MPEVFFRDDDLGDWNEALQKVASLFLERHIPVNYQVVPTFLTNECVGHIRNLRARHPNMIHLNQHGYRHEQFIHGKHHWSEFVGGRSFDDQLETIRLGRELLANFLQEDFDPLVFTPPQHSYDRNTLRALEQLGFEILSASFYPRRLTQLIYHAGRKLHLTAVRGRGISYHGNWRSDSGLFELSISVALDDAGPVRGSVDQLLEEFSAARMYTNRIGIMLHHNAYKTQRDFEVLTGFIDALIRMSDIEFTDMGTIFRQIKTQTASAARHGEQGEGG